MNRQQHFYDALERGQEVLWLVEDAMAQTGTDQDAEETVDKEGVKVLVLDLLFLIQPFHDHIGQCQSDDPHQTIPAHCYRTQMKCLQVRLPDDIIQYLFHYTLNLKCMISPSWTM